MIGGLNLNEMKSKDQQHNIYAHLTHVKDLERGEKEVIFERKFSHMGGVKFFLLTQTSFVYVDHMSRRQ